MIPSYPLGGVRVHPHDSKVKVDVFSNLEEPSNNVFESTHFHQHLYKFIETVIQQHAMAAK